MTTIIGYFFGAGVATAVTKGKSLSVDDVRKLIANKGQIGRARPALGSWGMALNVLALWT